MKTKWTIQRGARTSGVKPEKAAMGVRLQGKEGRGASVLGWGEARRASSDGGQTQRAPELQCRPTKRS